MEKNYLPPDDMLKFMERIFPKIEWQQIRELNALTLFELCALSVGEHPASISLISQLTSFHSCDPKDYDGGLEEMAEKVAYQNANVQECERRISVAVNHLPPLGELRYAVEPINGRETLVNIKEFAAWAIRLGWSLPSKFPRDDLVTATHSLVIEPDTEQRKFKPKQKLQQEAILKWLADEKYNALSLPKWKYDAPGVKAKALEALAKNTNLFPSHVTFNKAWEQLSLAKLIKYEK